MRPGEDRPFDRVVDQGRVRVPTVSAALALAVRVDRQPVLPLLQTRHEARQGARRVVGEELRRDVHAVQQDGHLIQRDLLFIFLHADLDERIAARDHVRAAGEDLDREIARPFRLMAVLIVVLVVVGVGRIRLRDERQRGEHRDGREKCAERNAQPLRLLQTRLHCFLLSLGRDACHRHGLRDARRDRRRRACSSRRPRGARRSRAGT